MPLKKLLFLSLMLSVLAACTSPVTMKNARTGQTATCGPYATDSNAPEREGRCISDFQRQGYERSPD
jgi:hypothetical protein